MWCTSFPLGATYASDSPKLGTTVWTSGDEVHTDWGQLVHEKGWRVSARRGLTRRLSSVLPSPERRAPYGATRTAPQGVNRRAFLIATRCPQVRVGADPGRYRRVLIRSTRDAGTPAPGAERAARSS
jgi:hypothetical protein